MCIMLIFFGPKKEKRQCRVNELFPFNENKDKICSKKTMENGDFVRAIKEAELMSKVKKCLTSFSLSVHSVSSHKMSSLKTSTPKQSKDNISV